MANELTIIKKVEQHLKKPRTETVFPLTPTHRKELRNLRDTNIGNLRGQLSTIRTLKEEDYTKKYSKDIEKEIEKERSKVDELNVDWDKLVEKIIYILKNRIALEKKLNNQSFQIKSGYNDVSNLRIEEARKFRRTFSFPTETISKQLARKEFDGEYGIRFKTVSDHISKLDEMYEEAINFGDLEIVKQLYYELKNADQFLKTVSNIKV